MQTIVPVVTLACRAVKRFKQSDVVDLTGVAHEFFINSEGITEDFFIWTTFEGKGTFRVQFGTCRQSDMTTINLASEQTVVLPGNRTYVSVAPIGHLRYVPDDYFAVVGVNGRIISRWAFRITEREHDNYLVPVDDDQE